MLRHWRGNAAMFESPPGTEEYSGDRYVTGRTVSTEHHQSHRLQMTKCYLVCMNHKDMACGVCTEVRGHPLPPPPHRFYKDRVSYWYIADYAGWPLSPRNPLVSSFPVLGCQMHTKTPVLTQALGSKSCPHCTVRAVCVPSLQGSSGWLKTWDPSAPCLCVQRSMLRGPDSHTWLNKNLFLLR